jgi:hypothetical protein
VNFVITGKQVSCEAFKRIGGKYNTDGSDHKRYSACGARIGAFVTKNKAVYEAA